MLFRSSERTPEDLELIFEELNQQRALAHLPSSVKRELASIVVLETHARAGAVRECRRCENLIFYFVRFRIKNDSFRALNFCIHSHKYLHENVYDV